jgi:hypothetical protein
MKLPRALLVLTVFTAASSATLYAQSTQTVVKFPAEIEFKAPINPGASNCSFIRRPNKVRCLRSAC